MIVGIDFGTTNSSLAFTEGTAARVHNARVTPHDDYPYDALFRTVALVDPTGDAVAAGKTESRRQQKQLGDGYRVVEYFKPYFNRWGLRRTVTELAEKEGMENALIGHARVHKYRKTYEVDGPYSRTDLVQSAAAVLRRIFETFANDYGRPEALYVGIPFGMWDFGKRRMLDALVQSGILPSYREALQQVHFVYEPVAIGYTVRDLTGSKPSHVLIFDSGGGTLDLAVLKFATGDRGRNQEPVELLALGGAYVAGRHFDERLLHLLTSRSRELAEASRDSVYRMILLDAVEAMKRDLSLAESANLGGELNIAATVTRTDFERAVASDLARVRIAIEDTVRRAGLRPEDIDVVRMAGGSSVTPCLRKLIESIFDPRITEVRCANPADLRGGGEVEEAMTSVSRGLAIYGARAKLRQRCPFEYSVYDLRSDAATVILPVNTPYGEDDVAEGAWYDLPLDCGATSATITVFQRYLSHEERILEIANVPAKSGLQVRALARKDGGLPTIALQDVRGRPIPIPSPDNLTEGQARRLLQSDEAAIEGHGTASFRLPLQQIHRGDTIRFHANRLDPRSGQGVIETIEDIEERHHWTVAGWRLSNFYLTVRDGPSTYRARLRLVDVDQHTPAHCSVRDIYQEQLGVGSG